MHTRQDLSALNLSTLFRRKREETAYGDSSYSDGYFRYALTLSLTLPFTLSRAAPDDLSGAAPHPYADSLASHDPSSNFLWMAVHNFRTGSHR